MVLLKRPIIFSLLLLIVILTQNSIALTYLPTSDATHYFGKQYKGVPDDWMRVEFAVYDNYGQELIDADYELPWADPGEYVYAYQVINNVTSVDHAVDFFSIFGIGKNSMASSEDIGSVGADPGQMSLPDRGQGPVLYWLGLDEEGDDDGQYFSSAHWEFDTDALSNGEHSYFLFITSDHDYKAGTYSFEASQDETVPTPNPEPCTLALLGLGSVLLLKKQRKKIS